MAVQLSEQQLAMCRNGFLKVLSGKSADVPVLPIEQVAEETHVRLTFLRELFPTNNDVVAALVCWQLAESRLWYERAQPGTPRLVLRFLRAGCTKYAHWARDGEDWRPEGLRDALAGWLRPVLGRYCIRPAQGSEEELALLFAALSFTGGALPSEGIALAILGNALTAPRKYPAPA